MESGFGTSAVQAFATVAINDVDASRLDEALTFIPFKYSANAHYVVLYRQSEKGRKLSSDIILKAAKDLCSIPLRNSQPDDIPDDIELVALLVYRQLDMPLSENANVLLSWMKAQIDFHQTHTFAAIRLCMPSKSIRYQLMDWAMRMEIPCFTFVDDQVVCDSHRLGVVYDGKIIRVPPGATIRHIFYQVISLALMRVEGDLRFGGWLKDSFDALRLKPEYGIMRDIGHYRLFSDEELK